MNVLKIFHSTERQKFWAFTFGLIMKVTGYTILFVIDWKIGLGVMLIDRGGELAAKSLQ